MTLQAPPPLDPYGGRIYDMAELMKQPQLPPPWRNQPVAVDGTLTLLTGRAGTGKTWILHELANATVCGTPVAGFEAIRGPALLIDAEMGEFLTVMRFKELGYSPKITVFDAMGMDLKRDEDRQLITQVARDFIGAAGGGFIGIDSLRRLCPSSKENESDDMSAVVSYFAWLMRDVKGAGVLAHHEGWEGGRARGSSGTVDQADAAWSLQRASDDDEDRTLKLLCTGRGQKMPRYCQPPAAMFLEIGEHGGIRASEPPTSKTEQHRGTILEALAAGSYRSQADVSEACGLGRDPSKTFRAAFKALVDAGEITQDRRGAEFRLADLPSIGD